MSDHVDNDIRGDTAAMYGGGIEDAVSPSPESSADTDETDSSDVVHICEECMLSDLETGDGCPECGEPLVPIRPIQDSYMGEVVGDGYEIVDKIGEGGMGEVYLGKDRSLGQHVAIKFLSRDYTADETLVMRFLNEARSYGQVNHPNAVTLLDYGQHDDGALYIMTEYVEGQSLTDAVHRRDGLTPTQVVSIATQCCEVLQAAHRRGIIHRDLKPENLMLVPGGGGRYTVKVLDFGIAKVADDDRAPLTETGAVFGTPEFMSPEQASGTEVDPRSDLYALGIIMFYALTGRLPFEGESQFALLNKQVNESPPDLTSIEGGRDVPPALASIVLRCMSKAPDDRYESAEALAEALNALDISSRDSNPSAPPLELEGTLGDDLESSGPVSPRASHPDGADASGEAVERSAFEIPELGGGDTGPVPIEFDGRNRDRVQWVGLTMAGVFSLGLIVWAMVPTDSPVSAARQANASEPTAAPSSRTEGDPASTSERDENGGSDDETSPPEPASNETPNAGSTSPSPSKEANATEHDETSPPPTDEAAPEPPPTPDDEASTPPSTRGEPSTAETPDDDAEPSSSKTDEDDERLPDGMALPPKQID